MQTMNSHTNTMPEKITSYVSMGTKIINIILLVCHICFAFLFWTYDVKILFYYSCLCSLSFIFSCIMLKKRNIKLYALTMFTGIFIFMILTVICLGWDYGFQQYCIGFVASLIFTDFYIYREKKLSKKTIAIVTFDVILYIALRLWTYAHPYIYKIDNPALIHGLYIANSLIGFAFLITYSCIYTNTVRRLEYELLEMANIDPLTGICNRRKMQQILKIALNEFESGQYQIVIAMLDVDHFKTINDTYGHDAGDQVLIQLANILSKKQKTHDGFYVSRWGGEEFLIFYKEFQKSQKDIIKEFDELRVEIQNTVINCDEACLGVTVTIGLAFNNEGKSVQELIKEADNNLYSGKETGRNRVIGTIENSV